MTTQPSTREPGLPVDYYAPDFRLTVDGYDLDSTTRGDVLEVKVVLDLENMTSADLTVNNWDDTTFDFKYTETPTFDLGRKIKIELGYVDNLVPMLTGQVATLSPRFPESGPPSLQISVVDGLLPLRDAKPPEGGEVRFEDVFDWEIAERIAQRHGLQCNVTEDGPHHDLVVQANQSDLAFLKERAKRIDFDVFMTTDPSGVETLNFIRPTDGRDDRRIRVYTLNWGESLIEFSPVLTLSRQVSKVVVRGWDPRNKEPIVGEATADDLPSGDGTSGPAAAAKLGASGRGKQEAVVDAPVFSKQEADQLARSLLADRAYTFVTGSGRTIGLPHLRPGDNLEIGRLSERFCGTYYVTKVEHTFNNSGYLTQFDVRRTHDRGPRQTEDIRSVA